MIISDLEKDENEYGEGLGVWRGGGTRLARCPINEGTRINHPTQPTTVIQRHYPLHYLYSFLIMSLLEMHHNNKRIAYIFGDGLLEGRGRGGGELHTYFLGAEKHYLSKLCM